MTPPVPPTPAAPGTALDLNTRVAHGDTRFPKELWGKTLGEAMRFYSIMREDFMRRNNPNQPPLAGEPPVPIQPPAPPAPRPGYQPPAAPSAPAGGGFDEATVQRMIQQAVAAAFSTSPLAIQAADSTHDRMKREYGDWMHYEAEILQTLEGASAEQLANPDTWRTAYFFIKGRKLSEGFQPPAPNGGPPSNQPPVVFGAPNGAPTVTRPPNPPTSDNPTWFTEGSTAPTVTPGTGVDPRNDPRVIAMAHKHGIPVDEYVQWLGGNVPPMVAPARTA